MQVERQITAAALAVAVESGIRELSVGHDDSIDDVNDAVARHNVRLNTLASSTFTPSLASIFMVSP